MLKTECASMKCLAWTDVESILDEGFVLGCRLSAQDLKSAITLIGKERVPDGFHVCPNLVRPACFQYTFYPRDRPERFQHAPMGDSGFAHFALRW